MSVEVRPLSVLCNIQCLYCYQHPQRDAGNIGKQYDLVKIKKAVAAEGRPFTLFGGEPLLLPLKDLEDLWAWGYEKYGSNMVQTNGTLVNDEHIKLFKKYGVGVGISLDGPEELNDVRWHGTLTATRQSTAKAQKAIEKLCAEGIHPALIVTLHRGNAIPEKLPKLLQWIRELCALGVVHFRIHLLESENALIRLRLSLTAEQNTAALIGFYRLSQELPQLKFDLFSEMNRLLMGDDQRVSCIWAGCDPYTTAAVRGVEGHGQRSNCGRTNKEGIDFVKASSVGFERYVSLYGTAQESGGCHGCRFFLMCKGQCPGTAIDGDWRNRTEHCEVWKTIFELLEKELVERGQQPVSLSPSRESVEKLAIERWTAGQPVSISDLLQKC